MIAQEAGYIVPAFPVSKWIKYCNENRRIPLWNGSIQNLPYLLAGISVGGQYALIAIGYTMVYGILRLINFAHGDIFMVAGLIMVYAISSHCLFTYAISIDDRSHGDYWCFLVERVAYKPLRQRTQDVDHDFCYRSFLSSPEPGPLCDRRLWHSSIRQFPGSVTRSQIFGASHKESYCDHTDPYHCSGFGTGML